MYAGKTLFAQIMDFLPWKTFHRLVSRHEGNRGVRTLPCADQFRVLAIAQLTGRESLRDIQATLSAQSAKLYHMGIRSPIRRSTLADANERRDWRIHAEFAQRLIAQARALHADEDPGLDLDSTVYALDSSTIDLCLSVFPWARFRSTKSGVKLHALLDLRGSIPAFIHVSEARRHDVNVLDLLVPEPGAFYVMDRAYIDFARLFHLHSLGAFFVVRAKSNTRFRRRYSRPVDKPAGVLCDQTIVLTGVRGRMRLEGGARVSSETIYRFVWRDKRKGGDLHTHLRHSSKKRRKRYGKNDFRGRIPDRVDISERPDIVDARARFGDWEGDTVVGAGHRGGLVTLAERRSRLLLAAPIPRKTKAETAEALCRVTNGLDSIIDTITYDNGREFSDYAAVSGATGSDAYFARPYRSWERGLNEHSNGLLRQHFPKSMPLDAVTDVQVRRAVSRINHRPRKCLGFKTPVEVLQNAYDSGEITGSRLAVDVARDAIQVCGAYGFVRTLQGEQSHHRLGNAKPYGFRES